MPWDYPVRALEVYQPNRVERPDVDFYFIGLLDHQRVRGTPTPPALATGQGSEHKGLLLQAVSHGFPQYTSAPYGVLHRTTEQHLKETFT